MKKLISVVLALALVLSLSAVAFAYEAPAGINSLAIVGSNIPGVGVWDPADAAGDMDLVADYVYEKVVTLSAGTKMEFKVAGNDGWYDNCNFGTNGKQTLTLGSVTEMICSGVSGDMSVVADKDITIKITVDLTAFAAGTGSATVLVEEVVENTPETITLVDGVSQSITVPAGGSVNVVVDATASDMTLEVSGNRMYWDWYVQSGKFPSTPGASGAVQVPLLSGGTYTVAICNNSADTDQVLDVVASSPVAGTWDNPAELVIGENIANAPGGWDAYFITWTATEDGELTIAIDTEKSSDWTYQCEVIGANNIPVSTETHFSDDEVVISSETLTVSAGDEVQIIVATVSDNPATVVINASFVPGTGSDVPGDGDNTGDDSGDTDDKIDYISSDVALILGDNTLTLDSSAATTLYEFKPDEVGVYTFTASDANALVGDWNVSAYPQDRTENKTNTLEWTCTSVGQSILIGVSGVETTVLNVEKTGDYTITTIDWIVYENTADLKDYEMADGELVKVDVTDDKADAAVLGEDGYYHLNTADGPILLVWMGSYDANNNPIGPNGINIINAAGLGRIGYIEYDADGNVAKAIDYTNAVIEYSEVADDGYYPLTADLIEIYQNFGTKEGWYDDDVMGFYLFDDVEVDPETAWMFCCYYVESADNGGSDDNGNADDNANAGDNGENVVLSDYRVVGNADWLGNWDPANESGRMVEASKDVYKITYKNVAAGEYQFKITQGSWDKEHWGGDGPDGNYVFTVEETADVTITFNAATGEIFVAINGEEIPKTADAGMIGLIVLMVLASTVAVVCTKKKFF